MKSEVFPISRKNDLVVQELDGEILIYDLMRHKAFSLNQVSTAVWQACDGKASVAGIAKTLTTQFKTAISEDYVWLALDKLKSEELLIDAGAIDIDFDGLSRREVIKRAGIASLVALPVVAALVAPAAVGAQSLLACGGCVAPPGNDARLQGCPCASNNDCCGNCTAGTCNGPLSSCLNPGNPCCPPNFPVPPADC